MCSWVCMDHPKDYAMLCLLGLREEMNRHKQDSVGKRLKLLFLLLSAWWKCKKNQPIGEVGGWFCPPPKTKFPQQLSNFSKCFLGRREIHHAPSNSRGPRHVNPRCIHRAFPWEEPLTNHQPANHESMLVIRYRRYKDYRSIHRLWSYDFIWAYYTVKGDYNKPW